MKRARVPWQPPAQCRIVALKPTLQPHVSELERELDQKIQIVADIKREDFFNIITEDVWYYIHVYGSTIYLVESLPLATQPIRKRSRGKSPDDLEQGSLMEAHAVSA